MHIILWLYKLFLRWSLPPIAYWRNKSTSHIKKSTNHPCLVLLFIWVSVDQPSLSLLIWLPHNWLICSLTVQVLLHQLSNQLTIRFLFVNSVFWLFNIIELWINDLLHNWLNRLWLLRVRFLNMLLQLGFQYNTLTLIASSVDFNALYLVHSRLIDWYLPVAVFAVHLN